MKVSIVLGNEENRAMVIHFDYFYVLIYPQTFLYHKIINHARAWVDKLVIQTPVF